MIITFDLGTTFFKACLFDETGRLVALARVVTPTDRPREGQGQITVENFRGAIASLVEELRERAPEAVAEARAVGFATQANTFALLDVDDRPIHPMILWSDRRSASDLDTLVKPVDALNDPSVTGMLEISDGFSPTKVLWLRRHEPEAFARGVRFSTISDELTRWFTGQQVCEAGAAGLTSLLNIHTLTWRTEAIDALDLSHLR